MKLYKLLILILFLVYCETIWTCKILITTNKSSYTITKEENKDTLFSTKYHHDIGLITADGSIIDINKLNKNKLRWVAISRNLLKKYSMGDTIIIESEIKELSGEWVIHYKMAKRWKNKIDFLLPKNDKYNFYNHTVIIMKKRKTIGKV